jgi:hypothetical protein
MLKSETTTKGCVAYIGVTPFPLKAVNASTQKDALSRTVFPIEYFQAGQTEYFCVCRIEYAALNYNLDAFRQRMSNKTMIGPTKALFSVSMGSGTTLHRVEEISWDTVPKYKRVWYFLFLSSTQGNYHIVLIGNRGVAAIAKPTQPFCFSDCTWEKSGLDRDTHTDLRFSASRESSLAAPPCPHPAAPVKKQAPSADGKTPKKKRGAIQDEETRAAPSKNQKETPQEEQEHVVLVDRRVIPLAVTSFTSYVFYLEKGALGLKTDKITERNPLTDEDIFSIGIPEMERHVNSVSIASQLTVLVTLCTNLIVKADDDAASIYTKSVEILRDALEHGTSERSGIVDHDYEIAMTTALILKTTGILVCPLVMLVLSDLYLRGEIRRAADVDTAAGCFFVALKSSLIVRQNLFIESCKPLVQTDLRNRSFCSEAQEYVKEMQAVFYDRVYPFLRTVAERKGSMFDADNPVANAYYDALLRPSETTCSRYYKYCQVYAVKNSSEFNRESPFYAAVCDLFGNMGIDFS